MILNRILLTVAILLGLLACAAIVTAPFIPDHFKDACQAAGGEVYGSKARLCFDREGKLIPIG